MTDATTTTDAAPAMRRCVGSTRYAIEAHDDLAENFPVQPSAKDGLGRMCKPHWRQYTSGLARDAKARKDATLTPAQESEIAERQAETGDAPKRGRRSQAEVVESITAKAKAAGAKVSAKPARKPKLAPVDGLGAQRAEHAELERRLTAVGGPETDAGQAILEEEAAKAAEARVSRRGAKVSEPVEQEGDAE